MNYSEEDISNASIKKVAELFNLPYKDILPNYEFGKDLLCDRERSDFKENEFDLMLFDIRYVADRKTTKELNSEKLVIRTVNDYCEHMIRSYETNPKRVVDTLGLSH